MSFEQDIQRKEFERRLHILKGFSNLNEVATIQISTLVKSIGAENIYEHSGLERMTKDVLNKGVKEDIFKAKKFINGLTSVNILGENGLPTTVYVEKGHMDFSGKSRNSNLQEKKITDKNGHQTTRYVKNGEDQKEQKQAKPEETSEDENISPKLENNTPADEKSPEQWASETASEDLKNYLDNDPNGDLAEEARWELDNRGELDLDRDDAARQSSSVIDNADPEEVESLRNSYKNMDDNTLNKYIGFDDNDELSQALMEEELNNRNGGDEEPYPDAKDDTATIMQQFMSLDTDKQSEIMAASIEHNVSIKAALAMSGGSDNTETHAKIDAAQNALNDLKTQTGHPDAQDDDEWKDGDDVNYDGRDGTIVGFEDGGVIVRFEDERGGSEEWVDTLSLNEQNPQTDTGTGDNTGFEDVKGSEEKDDMSAIFGDPDEDENKYDSRGDGKSVDEDNKDFHDNNNDDKSNLDNAVQWVEDFINNSDKGDSIEEKELYDNVPDEYRDLLDDAINEYDRKTLEENNKNSK